VVPRFFLGFGSCDKARWSILGATGSEWAFVAFLLFILAAFVAARRG
jgi:disulfide bond formation protein DsbB